MEKIIKAIKIHGNQELKDIYIVNEKTHTVYYVLGVSLDKNVYYTTTGEYTKVQLPNLNNM